MQLVPTTAELTALDPLQTVAGLDLPPELFAAIPTSLAGNLTGSISGGALGPATLSGTLDGILGGNVLPGDPVTLPVSLPIRIPVSIAVSWTVTREGETVELSPDECVRLDRPEAPLGAGFLLAPPIVELVSGVDPDSPQHVDYAIGARIVLDTGIPDPADPSKTIASDPVVLVPLRVAVPSLAVPTVAAFFIHKHFAPWDVEEGVGAALVATPANSPLKGLEDLLGYLRVLEPVVHKLRVIGRFAAYLAGIRLLASAMSSHPHIRFVSRDEIPNLNRIKLIDVDREYEVAGLPIPGTDVGNDVEAEDVLSSLLLIGPPPVPVRGRRPPQMPSRLARGKKDGGLVPVSFRCRALHCYNRRDFRTGRGHMVVRVGVEMCTLIADSHRIHNDVDAEWASVPPGRIDVRVNAPGPIEVPENAGDFVESLLAVEARRDGFGDRLSSVRFGVTTVTTGTLPPLPGRGRRRRPARRSRR
ncbi:MAG: hypothetical protein ACRENB_03140 [Gemmatimonadales bacterium]